MAFISPTRLHFFVSISDSIASLLMFILVVTSVLNLFFFNATKLKLGNEMNPIVHFSISALLIVLVIGLALLRKRNIRPAVILCGISISALALVSYLAPTFAMFVAVLLFVVFFPYAISNYLLRKTNNNEYEI